MCAHTDDELACSAECLADDKRAEVERISRQADQRNGRGRVVRDQQGER